MARWWTPGGIGTEVIDQLGGPTDLTGHYRGTCGGLAAVISRERVRFGARHLDRRRCGAGPPISKDRYIGPKTALVAAVRGNSSGEGPRQGEAVLGPKTGHHTSFLGAPGAVRVPPPISATRGPGALLQRPGIGHANPTKVLAGFLGQEPCGPVSFRQVRKRTRGDSLGPEPGIDGHEAWDSETDCGSDGGRSEVTDG